MNITYIVNVFPKISETFVLDQITYLIDQGHNVTIIAAEDRHEQVIHQAVFDYNLQEKTFYPKRTPQAPGIELSPELISTLLCTDIIHAHFANWPAETARQLSEITGIPFIFTAHAYDIFNNPDIALLHRVSKAAQKIVTISTYNVNYLSDLLGDSYKNKFEVIHCAINLEKIGLAQREKKPTKPVILVCGRFVEKKGIPNAIKAFTQVVEEVEAELKIIGDGPMRPEVEELIRTLNIDQHVHLLGELDHEKVFAQMGLADIFLLPSITAENGDREGLPVSILEAQALGLPVVSTLHSGIPEGVLDGQTGFLVPERDEKALAHNLLLLLKDKQLRITMGQDGRTHISKQFNRRLEYRKLEDLFTTIISGEDSSLDNSQNPRKLLQRRLQAVLQHLIGKLPDTSPPTKDANILHSAILTKKIIQKDSQIDQLSEELNRIKNTFSWKMTAPLRLLGRYIRSC